ncbi:MAG: amidase domain-containing protein [Mycobacterium sp.]
MSPASVGVPSRSETEGWETSYLDDADTRWRAGAEASESGFDQHLRNVTAPGGTTWRGEAADAALDRAFLDLTVVRTQSELQRQAAGIALEGSANIQWARRQVLDAIAEAEDDGFRVGEDLTVTDTRKVELGTAAARAVAATEHAEFIRWRAEQLVATDALVGQQLQAKAAELEGVWFDGEGNGNQGDPSIRLVDNEEEKEPPPPLLAGPELSESRRAAVDYAEKWAEGFNPDFASLGGGDLDCTNFASQVMRAGGFGDVGNAIDDWHRGDSDDWYYQNDGLAVPGNTSSKTWTLAKENHNFVTQHSGRGEIVEVAPTPSANGLDPLAPSKAGLLPGDLIYYKDADGEINHGSVCVGQAMVDGVPTDVINQHSGGIKAHDDWMPDSGEYTRAPAQAEFVRLRYPGE